MLRSPITLNRTAVQPGANMKQPTTRRLLPTPTASGRFPAHLPHPETAPKLAISVRLFKA